MKGFKKISKEKMSYFTEKGELVILNGKALRHINKGEVLISFGAILTEEDLK